MSKFDLYQEITRQISQMLEQGVAPWRSPILGRTSAGHPKNAVSDKRYRGVNVFLLAYTAHLKGYGSSYWMTFNQAREKGGSVRKGEKATMIVFFKQLEVEDRATHDPKKIPMLRYYNVFNIERRLSTTQPYTVDVARLVAADKSKDVNYDADAFTKWMELEFDLMVKEGMTSRESTYPIPLFEQMVRHYVRENVAPAITDLAHRSESNCTLDLRNEQSGIPLGVRRAVWKRIIYVALKENGQIQPMLGPYFDVTGREETAALGGGGLDGTAKVPCPTAPHASLVGGLLVTAPESTSLSVPLGTATPFSKAGDAIDNRSDMPARARLGINDDIADDNGDGYADVIYRVEPIR